MIKSKGSNAKLTMKSIASITAARILSIALIIPLIAPTIKVPAPKTIVANIVPTIAIAAPIPVIIGCIDSNKLLILGTTFSIIPFITLVTVSLMILKILTNSCPKSINCPRIEKPTASKPIKIVTGLTTAATSSPIIESMPEIPPISAKITGSQTTNLSTKSIRIRIPAPKAIPSIA